MRPLLASKRGVRLEYSDQFTNCTECSRLGACNPALAHRALVAERDIGLLLPCNVVVREEPDGRLIVGVMDPVAVLQMTSNMEVAKVAHEVFERQQRVKASLMASPGAAVAANTQG